MVDLYIAPGHGYRTNGTYDPGTRGPDGRYENLEANEVVAFAAAAAERCGISFVAEQFGTDSDVGDPNYVGSINAINDMMPTVCIELHYDWAKGPDKFVSLHSGSTSGTHLSKCLASGAKDEGLVLGGGGDGHSKDTNYGTRNRLAFVRRTHPPAALVELARIRDFPLDTNRKQAEAIIRGVCSYLGKKYIPAKPAMVYDHPVGIVWGGDADYGMAAMIARKHAFPMFTDEEIVQGVVSLRYAVAIGKNRQAVIDVVGDGVEVGGQNRDETADRTFALLMSDSPSRTRPWATS